MSLTRTRARKRVRHVIRDCAVALVATLVCTIAQADHRPAHTPDWTDFNPPDPGLTLLSLDTAVQALVLLIANPAPTGITAGPCHFSGTAIVDDVTPPPFGSGLERLVFEPLSLGPGETVAVHVAVGEDAPGGSFGQARILEFGIVPDHPGRGPCGLVVEALGYDRGSEATEVHVHRFTFGVEKTLFDRVPARTFLPLGFAGGNAGQQVRVILSRAFKVGENQSSVPAQACALTGELVARTVPETSDGTFPAISMEHGWPIKWQGPANRAVAIVHLPLSELGAGSNWRVDALLGLRFDRQVPAACLVQLQGMVQIADSTGRTRSAVPTDRVFFGYSHFSNSPLPGR